MNNYDLTLKNKILALLNEKPMNYGQCCQSEKYKQLKDEIDFAVQFTKDHDLSYKTKMFFILNEIHAFPKCCICKKDVTKDIVTLQNGYNKYKTWENADIANIVCNDEKCIKQNRVNKIKNTNMLKYGVDNPWKSTKIKEKIRKTNFLRYGISNGGNSKIGRLKAKQTLTENFGKAGLKSEKIRQKRINTALKKYGVSSYTKTTKYKLETQKRNLNEFINKLKNDPELNILQDISNFETIDQLFSTEIDAICTKCGNKIKLKLNGNNYYKYGTYSSCQKCHPSFSKSFDELQLFEFLKSFNLDVAENSRTVIAPYELDVYVASKRIAFEFDGIYWHSDDCGLNKTYHLNKTELCEKQGIQLIHIFENEWKDKNEIVKSRISGILGFYAATIYARKCTVKHVDSAVCKKFLNENHLQGAVNAKVNLGLYFNDELVSLMTFSKCRFDKKHEWELVRFCNRLGYHVPGAAGKLLKEFERKYSPKSIVSYADKRWSKGKLYAALGFKLDHASAPNYWYWKNNTGLLPRQKFQKHKLKNILKIFDEKLSESENMKNNGYHKIYDCGNLVYVKYYNKENEQ